MQLPDFKSSPAFARAKDSVDKQARRFADQIAKNPAAGIGACFGAGFLAGKLPVLRILAGGVRTILPLAPPLLAAVGAVRVWNLVAPKGLPLAKQTSRRASDDLNHLLSIELASHESYSRVAPLFDGEDRRVIEHLRNVHEDSVRRLKAAIQELGGDPLLGTSPWDGLADQLAHVTGGRLVDSTLLSLMRISEESAIRNFEASLMKFSLTQDHQTLVRRHLLPRAHENLNSLLRLQSHESSLATT